MFINNINQSDLFNKDFMKKLLTEVSKASIPQETHKILSSKENREKMKEKYGDDAFLMPTQLKFPVVNPKNGKYDCKLIYAARIRAKQYGYNEIAEKAEKLYTEQQCSDKIKIQINDHNESYDLIDLINLLEIDITNEG